MVENKKHTGNKTSRTKRKKIAGPQRFQLLELLNMDYDSVFEVFKEIRDLKNKE